MSSRKDMAIVAQYDKLYPKNCELITGRSRYKAQSDNDIDVGEYNQLNIVNMRHAE
ncbi:MAG: hypothetical protein K2M44_04090 [Clostridia bacterium]|nr:hypothetical protein [Clostridia bacterium]